ncbi:MAG: putative heme-binding domain-containing protein [Akkermansiaceae bacterium]|jgi:putative heme-binding domain-containing protein
MLLVYLRDKTDEAFLKGDFNSICHNQHTMKHFSFHPLRILLVISASLPAFGALPSELESSRFSDSDITPSPACLCAHPNGDVFVGVDMLGSLGKGAGKGRVVRLRDTDTNGKADEFTVFANLDNPRGLFAVDDKLYVLHTVIPASTGVMTGMHLSVLTDADGDGVADGQPKRLIKNISSLKHNQSRGADHTTNGIRMGIDGWIYIAIGDFGFVDAEGTDGKKLTMLGGGVLRVRPDGSEMEVYTHGMRNIYDVAIDPFMNIFTRGNTNDGGGWNIRFTHQVQSGEYGYPVLFKHFTDEVIPALVDLGGGSGTGVMFFQEPGWPEKYNNVPMMGDWGRSHLYIHRITPDGPSFTQKEEPFIQMSQIADVDVDGSGRLYLAAWNGAGYKGNPKKGFVEQVIPKGWTYKPFPELGKLSGANLVKGLRSESSTTRLHVQQEILKRADAELASAVLEVINDQSCRKEGRVAAIFAYSQLLGEKAVPALMAASKDKAIMEFCLRAAADRVGVAKTLPTAPFVAALKSDDRRVQVAAAVALGRIGKVEAAAALLSVTAPPAPGSHDKPNAGVVVPHVAVRALVDLDAAEACLAALDSSSRDVALWALRKMHSTKSVDGLIAKLGSTGDADLQLKIMTALARLYTKENPYDGSWWWGTQPDTRGPYYKPGAWDQSEKIEKAYRKAFENASAEIKNQLADIATKHRMNLDGIGKVEVVDKAAAAKKGEVGRTSIEDIVLSLEKLKGNKKRGKKVLSAMACLACHGLKKDDLVKGPNLLNLSQTKEQIAESILKPEAAISDTWVTVTMKDGTAHLGTLVSKTEQEVVVHNIAGIATKVKVGEVKSIAKQTSTLMGPGLANDLSLQQFADLIAFLHKKK